MNPNITHLHRRALGRRGNITAADQRLAEHYPARVQSVAAWMKTKRHRAVARSKAADRVFRAEAEVDRAVSRLAVERDINPRKAHRDHPGLTVTGTARTRAERDLRGALNTLRKVLVEVAQEERQLVGLPERRPGRHATWASEMNVEQQRDASARDMLILARYMLDIAAVDALFSQWEDAERAKSPRRACGRKPLLSPVTVMSFEWARILADRPGSYADIAKDIVTLMADPSEEAQRLREYLELEIVGDWLPSSPLLSNDRGVEAARSAVHRSWQYRRDLIDPYPGPRKGTRTKAEQAQLEAKWAQDPARIAERRHRLDVFNQRLIDASLWLTDDSTWEAWRTSPALTVDGTFVAARYNSRPRTRKVKNALGGEEFVEVVGSDADMGYYVRTTTNHAPAKGMDPVKMKCERGVEVNLAVIGAADADSRGLVPPLIVAAPVRLPGMDQKEALLDIVQSTKGLLDPADGDVGRDGRILLCTDRGYLGHYDDSKKSSRARWHLKLREDADLVMDYSKSALGARNVDAQVIFLEGGLYCASMPTPLRDATKDFRNGDIDGHTWRHRLGQRRAFLLREKEAGTADKTVVKCPAKGPGATLNCTGSTGPRNPGITMLPISPLTQTGGNNAAAICKNKQSVTLKATFDMDKYSQHFEYGSAEWAGHYGHLRSRVESANSVLKDRGYQGIGRSMHRRRKGLAAASVEAGLRAAATNFRIITRHEAALTTPNGAPTGPVVDPCDLEAVLESTRHAQNPPGSDPPDTDYEAA
ncbi:hypothetical protein [Kytococcus sp. Marseille-QA3725]